MQKMGLNEIREKYQQFFESKGHLRLKSFPLVPQGDKGLLIINSGMAPMKPFFSGEAVPPGKRVTTCQKCVRTTDIDIVGITSRHGTFFEMLGNFSFGDYFKREATAWAWEFITEVLKIPTDKLYVSIYLDDDEAYDIWTKEVGVAPERMVRLGKADNFWEIGAGPCGPCSEIYYDRGEEYGCGKPDCAVGCDCDRYVEFWNLVFTQYNNDGNDNYTPLASKNIDTGMGLERIACIMQGVGSLWEVDTILNITLSIARLAGLEYGKDAKKDLSMKIITDHVRSSTMMISDGILPSNEGRGYVLRRLIRRAAMHGRLLGMTEAFLTRVSETAIGESKSAYPELEEKRDYILRIIGAEEERFNLTLDSGMKILDSMVDELKQSGKNVLDGGDAFKLYDTYGFPLEITQEILAELDFSVDLEGFSCNMEEQRARARAATAALGDFGWEALDLGLPKDEETVFTGYTSFTEDKSEILAIVSEGEVCSGIQAGQEAIIVLDRTPFYAEMGGQSADFGTISSENAVFEVTEVHKSRDNKYMHSGKLLTGEMKLGDTVCASIDAERRVAIMRAHSATHLLHAALKRIVGTHVEQAGSLVTPDVLRFDFTHFEAIGNDVLSRISNEVNSMILESLPVTTREMTIDEAKREGAVALFGEKYTDVVRVVKMGDYSLELCGGTHLDNSAKIGSFILSSEFSVAAGVRRIEALVGKRAVDTVNQVRELNRSVADIFKVPANELKDKVLQFFNENRGLRKSLEQLRGKLIRGASEGLLISARIVNGFKVITAARDDIDNEWLKTAGDFLRDKNENVVAVLASTSEGKITFLAACGKKAVESGIKAGELVKLVTNITGGSGGGKPDTAMGGGKNLDSLNEALNAVEAYVAENTR